jgi:endonuclease I
MIYIYIYIMVFSFLQKVSSFNPYIYRTITPSLLRKSIHDDLNNNFKKVSWVRAKEILHKELNNIDIYGDNLHKKNVEHIFPQTYFKNNEKKNIMKSDMHNLLLCSEKLNSHRRHFKFVDPSYLHDLSSDEISSFNIINSECKSITNINDLISQKHDVVMVNSKNKLFIPSKQSRGSISRSLAYFSTKYNFTEELEKVIDINTLINWNQNYPVNIDEYHKNIAICKYHKVVNPFIVYPDLINYCFIDIATIDIEELYSNTNHLINEKDSYINDLAMKYIIK